ncbi:hypothetical protein PC116_g29104 [Phytophthora cactorum]|nr:hypothetical protein PC116_g29104 [Phytophthora cactorum]
MDHDLRVITVELGKQEEYDQFPRSITPSTTTATPPPPPPPAASYRISRESPYASSRKSCFACRNTLLLSYFNCCAICLGTVERGPSPNSNSNISATITTTDSLPLPITQPREPPVSPSPTSSSSDDNDDDDKPPSTTTAAAAAAVGAADTSTGTKLAHCPSPYCRYTHTRPVMGLFVLCEAVPSLGGLALLNAALYGRD